MSNKEQLPPFPWKMFGVGLFMVLIGLAYLVFMVMDADKKPRETLYITLEEGQSAKVSPVSDEEVMVRIIDAPEVEDVTADESFEFDTYPPSEGLILREDQMKVFYSAFV